jgi:hypothetical protein
MPPARIAAPDTLHVLRCTAVSHLMSQLGLGRVKASPTLMGLPSSVGTRAY